MYLHFTNGIPPIMKWKTRPTYMKVQYLADHHCHVTKTSPNHWLTGDCVSALIGCCISYYHVYSVHPRDLFLANRWPNTFAPTPIEHRSGPQVGLILKKQRRFKIGIVIQIKNNKECYWNKFKHNYAKNKHKLVGWKGLQLTHLPSPVISSLSFPPYDPAVELR